MCALSCYHPEFKAGSLCRSLLAVGLSVLAWLWGKLAGISWCRWRCVSLPMLCRDRGLDVLNLCMIHNKMLRLHTAFKHTNVCAPHLRSLPTCGVIGVLPGG